MNDAGDPTDRNRLDEEESPYLRQHADNPVNWQPWDGAALEAARDRDAPIFLSVGYSACHWCHVMEEESFADETVADVLNEEFVPVKVDREERPDLDRVYQTICQLVTGGGGWPLSAFLTPDGRPFYVGTYFPRDPPDRRNVPGFLELVTRIADSWADPDQREDMEERADQWTEALRNNLEETPAGGEHPPTETLDAAATAAVRAADREHGGFGNRGPKFPQPSRVELLLRAATRSGRDEPLTVACEALDAMARGGLYDHVGGGFHRYATDREWTVPHFEKMLYDNAELPRVYLGAFQLTDDPRYARVARETFAFVERELTHPDGGFYSTLDAVSVPPAGRLGDDPAGADTDGDAGHETEEGAFYVWSPAEVRDVLDGETAELFCERYGVTESGNFERGLTVLTETTSVPELAESHGLETETVRDRLTEARVDLFEARKERPRPARDEKVLAGWNGLMVSAFAAGSRVLGESLARPAERALGFVREQLWNGEDRRLARRYKDDGRGGDVKGPGYLEDYAFLGRGAFDLYQATGDVSHLAFALELARVIESEFYDAERGTLYFTPAGGESLVTRPQELQDQSTPSSLGVATRLLGRLDHFTERDFGAVVEDVLSTHADRVESSPLEHVSLALAADERERGALELTVAAEKVPEAWRKTLAEQYRPDAILSLRPPTEEGLAEWLEELGLPEAPPIWRGREARDGEPTVYACRSFTCSPPEKSLEAALEWAEENI